MNCWVLCLDYFAFSHEPRCFEVQSLCLIDNITPGVQVLSSCPHRADAEFSEGQVP